MGHHDAGRIMWMDRHGAGPETVSASSSGFAAKKASACPVLRTYSASPTYPSGTESGDAVKSLGLQGATYPVEMSPESRCVHPDSASWEDMRLVGQVIRLSKGQRSKQGGCSDSGRGKGGQKRPGTTRAERDSSLAISRGAPFAWSSVSARVLPSSCDPVGERWCGARSGGVDTFWSAPATEEKLEEPGREKKGKKKKT